MGKMTQKEIKALIAKARENDPKAYLDMREIYATTDMPYQEFIAHIRIIAERKR